MSLTEALQARQRTRPYLTRGAWLQAVTDGPYESCFIQATNTPAGCILYDNLTGKTERWTPTEADLLADDWQTCNGHFVR